MRLERERVELLAREAPLLGDHLGRDPLRDDLPALESLSERSPPFEPIGTRDIISTPAETTRSSWPDATAAAALKFPCIDEPHWRSTLVPHTVSGQPATSGDHPADVPALLADLGDAAHLHVLDLPGIEVVPRDEAVQHLCRELVAAGR